VSKRLLKLPEVCEAYGISRSTAYRVWRTWPHVIVGKQPRFRDDEIQRHLSNAGRIEAAAPKARPGHVIIPRSYVKSA
jgi:predicted DNA-binding transcriptional regulator AlpA